MRVECPCGFQGNLREQATPNGIFGRCFGCDTLYDQKGNIVPDAPVFKDIDAAMKFYQKMTEGKEPKSSTGKKRTPKKRKPAEKDSSTKLIEEKPKVPIYKTIHFYLRPGDSWPELLKDGRQEMDMSGPGTVVCCHQHTHGTECVSTCRSMA